MSLFSNPFARTSVPEEHRRAFLGRAAAAVLAALGLASGCGKKTPTKSTGPAGAMNNEGEGAVNKETVIAVVRKLAKDKGTPESIVEAIVHRLLPSIRLIPAHSDGRSETALGTSRVGGLPDLPVGVRWPRFADAHRPKTNKGAVDRPFSFLMQINLAEVSRFDLEQLLPKSGFLYFFLSWISQDPTEEEKSQVLFVPDPGTALRPTEAPVDLPEDQLYEGFKLNPRLEWTVPSPSDLGLKEEFVEDHLGLWDTLEEEVAAVQGFAPYCQSIHRMLGHPQLVQSPGVADGTKLLLQVDSDCVFRDKGYPETGMMWGDAGRVYYFVSEKDLKAHLLDSAQAQWECH